MEIFAVYPLAMFTDYIPAFPPDAEGVVVRVILDLDFVSVQGNVRFFPRLVYRNGRLVSLALHANDKLRDQLCQQLLSQGLFRHDPP